MAAPKDRYLNWPRIVFLFFCSFAHPGGTHHVQTHLDPDAADLPCRLRVVQQQRSQSSTEDHRGDTGPGYHDNDLQSGAVLVA